MRSTSFGVLVAVLLMAAGCDVAPTEPGAFTPNGVTERRSPRAGGGAFACPTAFDHVATDEASLLAAVASAAPGDVIGLDGFFPVSQPAVVATDGVTVTCATPGSGVFVDPGAPAPGLLLAATGAGVTIEGVRVDATGGGWGVYVVGTDDVRVAHNEMTCGVNGCAFFVAATNTVIVDNTAESFGSFSGLHLQAGIDGTRILRNTVIAHAPSFHPAFGGIRPRTGTDVLVKDNVVTGPWFNSISSVEITDSEYSENELAGALQYGVAINIPGSPNPAPVAGNTFRGNRIGDAAWAGILARSSCGNDLVNNRISGSTGILLDVSTGDNHVVATFGSVIDDGAHDCDGDGSVDPNDVSGKAGHGGHVPAARAALKTPEAAPSLPAMQ